MMKIHIFIIWICFISFVYSSKDQSCSAEDHDCRQSEAPARKYAEKASWQKYRKAIETAKAIYEPCTASDCSCYDSTLARDLAPFHGGINRTHIESVVTDPHMRAVKYQIINHRLYRSTDCMFEARCEGIEYFLHKLIDELPNMEFALNTRDFPLVNRFQGLKAVFSFSKIPERELDITYPAWAFYAGGPAISLYPQGIGRWDLVREQVNREGARYGWSDKRAQAFFRGSRTSHERDPLVLLSRAKPTLVDAQYTKNQAWKSNKDTLDRPPADEVHFTQHCLYKYLFNFRGVAASFRYKHLFLCNSLVFHVGSDWTEFFYDALKPWIHYVPVSVQLDEVEDLLEFFNANDDLAKEIAQRGHDFIWAHLRQEDVICYWRKLLTQYAALMTYKVTKVDPTLIERVNKLAVKSKKQTSKQ